LGGKAPPEYPARGKKVKQRSTGYRVRAALSDAASIFIWCGVWWVNGHLTVIALRDAGLLLQAGAGQHSLTQLLIMISVFLLSPWVAWAVHIVSSLIEGFAWRNALSNTGLTFLIVAALDMGSTFRGLYLIAQGQGIIVTLPVLIVIGFGAVMFAIVPERMILVHLKNLGILDAFEGRFQRKREGRHAH
jgi:hypothetical protein